MSLTIFEKIKFSTELVNKLLQEKQNVNNADHLYLEQNKGSDKPLYVVIIKSSYNKKITLFVEPTTKNTYNIKCEFENLAFEVVTDLDTTVGVIEKITMLSNNRINLYSHFYESITLNDVFENSTTLNIDDCEFVVNYIDKDKYELSAFGETELVDDIETLMNKINSLVNGVKELKTSYMSFDNLKKEIDDFKIGLSNESTDKLEQDKRMLDLVDSFKNNSTPVLTSSVPETTSNVDVTNSTNTDNDTITKIYGLYEQLSDRQQYAFNNLKHYTFEKFCKTYSNDKNLVEIATEMNKLPEEVRQCFF